MIISRMEAIAAGLPTYSPGPCLRGHTEERLVSNRKCPACTPILARQHNGKRVDRTVEMVQTVARNQAARKARRQALFPDREIITRPEAKQRGLTQYFTGRPCKRGHYADRRTSCGICLECPHIGKPETIKKHKRLHYQRNKKAYFARAAERRAAKRRPPWVDRKALAAIIAACPPGHHVDHIVPLKGEFVSGLHVPWNLQYLTVLDNLQKGNDFEHTPFGGQPLPPLSLDNPR